MLPIFHWYIITLTHKNYLFDLISGQELANDTRFTIWTIKLENHSALYNQKVLYNHKARYNTQAQKIKLLQVPQFNKTEYCRINYSKCVPFERCQKPAEIVNICDTAVNLFIFSHLSPSAYYFTHTIHNILFHVLFTRIYIFTLGPVMFFIMFSCIYKYQGLTLHRITYSK